MIKHIGKQLFHWTVVFICAAVFVSLITGYASAADAVAQPTMTLQSAVADIIGQATSGVRAGVEFLQAEIPDVIRQLLVWKATLAVFWALMHTFLFVSGVIALRHAIAVIQEQSRLESLGAVADAKRDAIRRGAEGYEVANVAYEEAKGAASAHVSRTFIGCALGLILTITGIVGFCNMWGQALTVVQIYIAPKVWLIEYAASLVK